MSIFGFKNNIQLGFAYISLFCVRSNKNVKPLDESFSFSSHSLYQNFHMVFHKSTIDNYMYTRIT